MTGHELDPSVRSVLTAPRGHRFPRTTAHPLRVVPWPPAPPESPAPPPLRVEAPQDRYARLLRQMLGNPRVTYMLEHGPVPHWMFVARQQREQRAREAREADASARAEPEPVLPRGRHRAPRRWWGWPATAISSTLFLGLTTLETVGRNLTHAIGILT